MNTEDLLRKDDPQQRKPLRLLLRPASLDDQQKRQHERVSTKRSVPVTTDQSTDSIEAKLVNVSISGSQVQVQQTPAPSTVVEVEVLPSRVLSARIVWSRPDGGGVQLGLAWEEPISIDDVWQIRAYTTAKDDLKGRKQEDLPRGRGDAEREEKKSFE